MPVLRLTLHAPVRYVPLVSWKAPGDPAAVLPGVDQPKLDARISPATEGVAGDWLCAWCLQVVASEKDRFRLDGQDEFSFSNPDGIRFEIMTFSEVRGCDQTGNPTLEYTWFPGHAWSYCQCGECGQHLGWFYNGQNDFIGLIKARIVRALCIRN